MSRIVAVSDFCSAVPPEPTRGKRPSWPSISPPGIVGSVRVTGGYLERLPLAAVVAGLADSAEIWSFAGRDGESDSDRRLWDGTPDPDRPGLTRRVFRADVHPAPYGSADLLAHLDACGVPDILCVWGLGVDAAILDACSGAIRIYNSIDAPALRIADAEAARFDLFLTGADWQSDEIRARVPGARTLVLPIGPEFASGETFFPTGTHKDRDVVYVACTQPYKRHQVLFDALEANPGMTALLVVGYGHLTEELRADAARRGLDVEIVGPVPHDEVNRQINRARVGVVCGIEDGAPAILTEYMLAGLPVLANAGLVCGRQYITPDTGLTAAEGTDFAAALRRLVDSAEQFEPRPVALARWGWPVSIARLGAEIQAIRRARHGKDAA
ncbi:glycosyltransferase [uncultured Paracoccus sp.]|uniref:glycosyltransferase n=1 Tax=Paracoccus sp. S1E-3 TaxID=2756130 RepID=UPI001C68ECE7|nr:glycosyltransferase [uncultured Paracoccus sp.]